jgi:hypothetical protein
VRLVLGVLVLTSTLVSGCSTADEAPTATWCAEMQPFVTPADTAARSLEVVEVTEENREQIERESGELRSRIAVLISSAPSQVREHVERMLLGSNGVTVDEIAAARKEVTSFYRDHC